MTFFCCGTFTWLHPDNLPPSSNENTRRPVCFRKALPQLDHQNHLHPGRKLKTILHQLCNMSWPLDMILWRTGYLAYLRLGKVTFKTMQLLLAAALIAPKCQRWCFSLWVLWNARLRRKKPVLVCVAFSTFVWPRSIVFEFVTVLHPFSRIPDKSNRRLLWFVLKAWFCLKKNWNIRCPLELPLKSPTCR